MEKRKVQNSSENSRKRGRLEKEYIQNVGKAIGILQKDINSRYMKDNNPQEGKI